jgi:hypothetical protein
MLRFHILQEARTARFITALARITSREIVLEPERYMVAINIAVDQDSAFATRNVSCSWERSRGV